jgi:flagellar biosynthesis component FlhA
MRDKKLPEKQNYILYEREILEQVMKMTSDLLTDLHNYKVLIENSFDGNPQLKQKVKEKFVRMFIIDFHKIISEGRSDKYSIYKNDNHILKRFADLIEENQDWKELVEKIRLNRNKIIGHNDWDDFLKYSYMSTKRIELEVNSYNEGYHGAKAVEDLKNELAEYQKNTKKDTEKAFERFGVTEFERDFVLSEELLNFISKTVLDLYKTKYIK